MLERLKKQVCAANLKLVAEGLVIQTWGNVSGIDRSSGNVVIKPSGVPYADLKPSDIIVLEISSKDVCEDPPRNSRRRTRLNVYDMRPDAWRSVWR